MKTKKQEEASKAVYRMKLKELPCAVSPTAPREAFLLLQRIEDRKMKGGRGRKSPTNNAATVATTTPKRAQEKGACKNERARGKRKVVYFKSASCTDRKWY